MGWNLIEVDDVTHSDDIIRTDIPAEGESANKLDSLIEVGWKTKG